MSCVGGEGQRPGPKREQRRMKDLGHVACGWDLPVLPGDLDGLIIRPPTIRFLVKGFVLYAAMTGDRQRESREPRWVLHITSPGLQSHFPNHFRLPGML